MRESVHRRSVSQLVAGFALIGYPLAGVLATAVGPAEPVEPAALYDAYATHAAAVTVAACLYAVAAILSGTAAVGLSHLLRSRGAVLGRLGVALMFIGSFGFMGWAIAQLMLAQAPYPLDRYEMIAYFDRASAVLLILLPLQLGGIVGVVLIAVALRRARVIPRWLMLLELATVATTAFVQSTDLASTTAGPLLTWSLGLIFYGYIGIHTLRTLPGTWQSDALPLESPPLGSPASTRMV